VAAVEAARRRSLGRLVIRSQATAPIRNDSGLHISYGNGPSFPIEHDLSDFRRLKAEKLIAFVSSSRNVWIGKVRYLGTVISQKAQSLDKSSERPLDAPSV
jgi:hypothetical protein